MTAGVLAVAVGWLAVGVLAVLDRRLAGTWVTPFAMFAFPLQVVLTLAVTLAVPLGFVAPAPVALLVLVAGPLILWCGQAPVLAWASPLPAGAQGTDDAWLGEAESRRVALAVSWGVVAVTAVAFLVASRGVLRLGEIVQPQFQLRFGSGVSGWARPVGMLLVVYWIGTARRWTRTEVLVLAALLISLVASFVKGTVLLPVVGGLLYRAAAGRLRLTVVRLGLVAALGVAFVFAVYLAKAAVWGLAGLAVPRFGADLVHRVAAYVFAGVLGFSGTWQGGVLPGPMDWTILVSPAWNLLAHLGGYERVSNVPTGFLYIDLRAAVSSAIGISNVRTLFGTLWTFAGPLGATALMLGLGVGSGLLYAAARHARNCWLLVVSSFLGAALVFGWFEYYFWHSFWYVTMPLGVGAALAVRRPRARPALQGVTP